MHRSIRLFPVFLILYEFCANMSNDMYLPALPLIADTFGIEIHQIQLTITAWLAGSMAVQLLIGPLADHYGRRPVLLGGGILFLLATLGCSFSPTLSWLIIARFLQGIGVCTMMVAGYASIHDLYSNKDAIHILVGLGTAAVIAPAIGPVLGGLLLLIASWPFIFFSLFCIGIVALLGLWYVMPESKTTSLQPWHFHKIIASYLRILSNRTFLFSSISFALGYAGVIGWITASPFLLMEKLHFTPDQFGWMQLPVFGGYIFGAQSIKRLAADTGNEKWIALGLILASISGIALLFFSFLLPAFASSFVIPMTFYTVGFGFAAAPLNRMTMTSTSESKGAVTAIFYLSMATLGTLMSLGISFFGRGTASSSLFIAIAPVIALIAYSAANMQKK